MKEDINRNLLRRKMYSNIFDDFSEFERYTKNLEQEVNDFVWPESSDVYAKENNKSSREISIEGDLSDGAKSNKVNEAIDNKEKNILNLYRPSNGVFNFEKNDFQEINDEWVYMPFGYSHKWKDADIEMSVDKGMLNISYDFKKKDENGFNYHENYQINTLLPLNSDWANVEAKDENGILIISVPKSAKQRDKYIIKNPKEKIIKK